VAVFLVIQSLYITLDNLIDVRKKQLLNNLNIDKDEGGIFSGIPMLAFINTKSISQVDSKISYIGIIFGFFSDVLMFIFVNLMFSVIMNFTY
jgi:hypothetical protein